MSENLHAKYEGSIWNASKIMTNVIFFFKVGQGQRSLFCMSGKPLPQATYMPNIKALSQIVQKLWPMLKLSNQHTNKPTTNKPTNRQGKNIMIQFCYWGHKKYWRWRPWRPSWISDQNDFSYFCSISPRCSLPSFVSVGLSVQEKKRKIDFQEGHHGGHLGFPIRRI